MQLEIYYDGIDQNCDGLSDYDADEDGYDSYLFGGDDCEDQYETINPGVAIDGCGGGNEDCDLELDEDCIEEDTGTLDEEEDDTGEEIITDDSGLSEDTGLEDDTAVDEEDSGEDADDTGLDDTGTDETGSDDTSSNDTAEEEEEGTSSSSGEDDSGEQTGDNVDWEAPVVGETTVREYEPSRCGCSGEQAWLPLLWLALIGWRRREKK